MIERRAKKISVIIFLFAVFILLAVFSGSWIYRMYLENTEFSEKNTISTVECSRYFFSVNPDSVTYENKQLRFEIKNTMGDELRTVVVDSGTETKEADVFLGQGMTQPVVLDMEIDTWFLIYPKECRNINYRNVSFEPNSD